MVLDAIRERVAAFLDTGGDALMRKIVTEALSVEGGAVGERREAEKRRDEIERRIDELIESLTPTNREFVDRKLMELKAERDRLNGLLGELDARAGREASLDAMVEEALASMRGFEEVFDEGTLEEQKELFALMVERIDVDPVGRVARAHIRRFPAPSLLGTGNLLRVVAGVRDAQQKVDFPPVDIIEIPLAARGTVLVPLAA